MTEKQATDSWDARLYEEKHAFVWKHGASLLELLAPQPGEQILDLGCGTGHLTAQLAAAGARVVGMDHSAAMIAEARRSYPELRFEIADARHLTFVMQFDAVFSNAVLHWIREADQVVEGVFRALKPGGRFVAEFGGKGNVKAICAALQNAVQALGYGFAESPWFFPGVGEYACLLETVGLEVTAATLFDRPTPLAGEEGMRDWLAMFGGPLFGGPFLSEVPPERRDDLVRHVEKELRPFLYREGSWFADYRRLRVVAWRGRAEQEQTNTKSPCT
jgi:trans-aconitate 2-methyltransferase